MSDKTKRRPSHRLYLLAGLVLLLGGLGSWLGYDWWATLPVDLELSYVGRSRCIECHQEQGDLWHGSHHDLAMDMATDQTVLGDFDNAELEHFGITSRMFRDADKFMVNTEGPDGELQDFEVQYVLGVEPLQQYMVELQPTEGLAEGEIGQLQVLRITWDTEGKRWYFQNPPDVHEKLLPGDDLHWTGIAARWNNSCADCHSTNLQKGYDDQEGVYHTTFSEIDVSCESCHGPGSTHVKLAESGSVFWDRHQGYGLARLKGQDPGNEIQSCAPCHSHRRVVHPGFVPGESYHDHFSNAVLAPSLYHDDGQIMEEVYVFGSFLQSKMYHKGIRCTDCHDPHTTRLKFEGNKLCTSCHQHPAAKYDTPSHHHHSAAEGTSCVECHMPETTYMEVDPRRDHSIRIPRPDLSSVLGTPNACSRCHMERVKLPEARIEQLHLKQYGDWVRAARDGAEDVRAQLLELDLWCADNSRQWYGDPKEERDHFATILSAARNRTEQADDELCSLIVNRNYPAIARATAISWLDPQRSRTNAQALFQATSDSNPQVREVAAMTLDGYASDPQAPYKELVKYVVPLLSDPSRSVRIAAVQPVARIPRHLLRANERKAFDSAFKELELGLAVNNDRAAPYVSIGNIYQLLKDPEAAEMAFRKAIFVEPNYTGARANLAELLQQKAEQMIRRMQGMTVEDAREKEQDILRLRIEVEQLRKAELANFARDASYAPGIADVQYRYGLGLYRDGQMEEAEKYLRRTVDLEPRSVLYLAAMARFLQAAGRFEDALPFARRLAEADENHDDVLKELQQQIQQQTTTPPGPSQ
ncbi:MAG: multiheme c-type cytochrome [Pirellulaceae bacterium]